MPAPVSVVIPTLDAASELPATLGPLMEGLSTGLVRELVVSDGGSTDATRGIAEEAGARMVEGPRGRGGQIARGVAVAQGDWLLILHADTWLPEGWTEHVAAHIGHGAGHAACFRLTFRRTGIAPSIVAGWANLRTRLFSLPFGDQGLLIHRDHLARIGGVPDIPLMEDVALARALKGHLRLFPLAVRTSAARYDQTGWVRQGVRNLWRLLRYLLGASPERLAQGYASRN